MHFPFNRFRADFSIIISNGKNWDIIEYSYDFEKQRAAQVWEFILDKIVTCSSPKDIPSLEELRERVKQSGLL